MIAQSAMDPLLATPLLGGLTPDAFMRRHWQRRPLVVRQALPGGIELLRRAELFALAASDAVESRLVAWRNGRWTLRDGPLPRSALPPLARPHWTLLVQGLDLHVAAARALLERFRFVPDARLDDLMLSYASDGGGVGAHVDAYDVFLLQARGRRRWRVGRVRRPRWVDGAPLKILAEFEPEHDWLLDAGDMLYLPPGWGHDGVAQGECLTCSIGFRAPRQGEIGAELLQRLADVHAAGAGPLYRDPRPAATANPGRIPAALRAFAADAVARRIAAPGAIGRALGEILSEPKPDVWFDAAAPAEPAASAARGVRLDRRSRMLYDERHVYLNGEAFRAAGRDATLMRRLADRRALGARDFGALGAAARAWLDDALRAGWLHAGGSA